VAEKIVRLIIECYTPTLQPVGMVMLFQFIRLDVQAGVDGFNGREVVEFNAAVCLALVPDYQRSPKRQRK